MLYIALKFTAIEIYLYNYAVPERYLNTFIPLKTNSMHSCITSTVSKNTFDNLLST